MKTNSVFAPGSPLEQVRQDFELWRRTRKRGAPIPENLWNSAVDLAREHGLHRTARALRLDYYSLKKRLGLITGAPRSRLTASFVELLPPGAVGSSACTIEMENAQGGKIKMQLQGLGGADLAALINSFWKSAS
jgi:hypothetical protein